MNIKRCLGGASAILLGFALATSAEAAEAAEIKFERQAIDQQIEIGYGLAVGRVDADQHVDLLLADKKEIVWYANPGVAGVEWPKHVIARNLTPRDNVCIAARDRDGDGLVEIAVGANWNPGETSDVAASGSLFYLQRPDDPSQPWKPTPIVPYEPTTHRMRWLQSDEGMRLAVLPLHGVDNDDGAGKNVFVSIYDVAGATPKLERRVDTMMHMTHNFDVVIDPETRPGEFLLIAGKEGYSVADASGRSLPLSASSLSKGGGETRQYSANGRSFAGIEPMHGTDVVFYRYVGADSWNREILDTTLSQGHALAAGDLFGSGDPEIVAGWRSPNANRKVGIRTYYYNGAAWEQRTIDDNRMACEDLVLCDFDSDGKLDIAAAGRSTANVAVYWNRCR